MKNITYISNKRNTIYHITYDVYITNMASKALPNFSLYEKKKQTWKKNHNNNNILTRNKTAANEYDPETTMEIPPLPKQQYLVNIRRVTYMEQVGNAKRCFRIPDVYPPSYYTRLRDDFTYFKIYHRNDQHFDITKPTLVLVHGVSMPSPTFDPIIQAIRKANPQTQILTYDLYGRGYSGRPEFVDYGNKTYVQQLKELLDDIGLKQIDLLGYSMGGSIISHFTFKHPEMVRKLIFVAPGGTYPPHNMDVYPRQAYSDALMSRNELAWKAFYATQSKRFDAYGLKDPKHLQRLKDNIVSDSKIEFYGYAYAIGASFLALFHDQDGQKRLKEIAKRNIPTICLWGTADTDVPFKGSKYLLECIPQAVLHTVEGASHSLLGENEAQTKKLGKIISDFVAHGGIAKAKNRINWAEE